MYVVLSTWALRSWEENGAGRGQEGVAAGDLQIHTDGWMERGDVGGGRGANIWGKWDLSFVSEA